MKRKMVILLISVILLSAIYYYISLPDYVVVNSISFSSKNTRDTEIKVVIYKYHDIDNTVKAIEQEHNRSTAHRPLLKWISIIPAGTSGMDQGHLNSNLQLYHN